MPQHITGYIYVMIMATVVFMVLQRPLTASLVALPDFQRRRNVWYGVTTAAFLSHNYWVYVAITTLIVVYALQRERNPLALYFTVLFAVPLFEMQVPGFGIVNYITELTHPRLLALVILMPVAFRLLQTREHGPSLHKVIHPIVLAYMLTVLLLTMPHVTTANSMRTVLDLVLGIWLPFYVVSRSLRDIRQMRETMAMLIAALCLLGVFAGFEATRDWLMFEALREPLGTPPPSISLYMLRESDGGGALRPVVTAGSAIGLGYLMGLGLCIWAALRYAMQPTRSAWIALAFIALGFIVALSRGPWVSAAAGLLLMTLMGPGFFRRLGLVTLVTSVTLVAASFTTLGKALYAYLPFVGSSEAESVDYRVRLVEVSMSIFLDNPLFGNLKYVLDPRLEPMRQGQGIIDIVNSYLAVAMAYGLVGLTFFLLPFVICIVMVARSARGVEPRHASMGITGRALLGTLVTTLLLLATTSSTHYTSIVYWSLLGMSSAYVAIAVRWTQSQRVSGVRAGRGAVPPNRMPAPARRGVRHGRGQPENVQST